MSAALIAVVVIESCVIALYLGWRVYSMYQEREVRTVSYQQPGGRSAGMVRPQVNQGNFRPGPPPQPAYPNNNNQRPMQPQYNQPRAMQPAPSPLYYANGA